jgi:hypothetical protein
MKPLKALGIIAAVLVCQSTLSASAQTTEKTSSAVESLHRAADLMRPTVDFFVNEIRVGLVPDKSRVPPSEQDFAGNYRKMEEAAGLIQRFAPAPFVSRAIAEVGSSFEGTRLPRPPTLREAAERCDRQRNPELTAVVAMSLAQFADFSWQSEAADAKYGPIVDNPAVYGEMTPPASPVKLLRNAKWVLDHDAVLRADFFTPQNMERFFGMAEPVLRTLDQIHARWEVKPLEKELAALPPAVVGLLAKCTYGADRFQDADGSLKGGKLYFECNYPNPAYPTLDDVIRVFGPPSYGPPLPLAPPKGSEILLYDFGGAPYLGRKVKRELSFKLGRDASFKEFVLSETF